ncbi:fibronectin type III domain-containing protein [Geodermatophilus sp. CPCC 206100]|uniref:fibronectin type III domain-containing protein n=1 Tax=Geodermatophilus sp. CPCC 206100 TaxID=3020054 RepID=UPI003B00F0CA
MTTARPLPGSRGRGAAPSASRLLLSARTRRALVAGVLSAATVTAGTVVVAGIAAAGTPPTGPGNIEVFPSRDMVAIEGYAAQAGQTATLTVTRGGQQIGTATGEVDETGFMEWNHEASPLPGGGFAGCFDGVTPDIRAGDQVAVRFDRSPLVDSMSVSSAAVTEVTASDPTPGTTNSVTISGTYGSDVSLDRFAVEVVNPEMRDAGAIGERAIGWSPNEAPAATQGHTVTGTAANGRFSVTFGNMSQEDQQMVFDGEKVALSWMADATVVEAQLGLTLAEHGLVGGGAPGCPAGPDGAEPPVSEHTVVWTSDTEATVTWAAAVPVAGAEAVDGYSVVAVDQTANGRGAHRQLGYEVGADATQVVLDGLAADALYEIRVRSVVDGELSAAFPLAGTTTTPDDGDTTAPVLTATPDFTTGTAAAPVRTSADRVLTLSADEGAIYYTLDGSAVTTEPGGNVPSATAKLYPAGTRIPVTGPTTVSVAVIDAAGNATHETGVVAPAAAQQAVPPTNVGVTGLRAGSVDVAWSPVPDATSYRVRVWLRKDAVRNASGAITAPATTTVQTQYDTVVPGASATVALPRSESGFRYVFRVQSRTPFASTYSEFSADTPVISAVVPGDDIGLVRARFDAGDDFQIDGTGSVAGATITVHRQNAAGTGPVLTPIPGYPTATVGALDELGVGAWDITMDPAPATNPGVIYLLSSNGDVEGPFTVEAR